MSFLTNKKVLGILAHPDDEVIFGWPIFQRTDIQKYLLTISDNAHWRKVGGHPIAALNEVCFNENIILYDCLKVYANFYVSPVVKDMGNICELVQIIESAISRVIEDIQPDYIFTHNPCGEYGHGTHEAIFKIVARHEKVKNLLFTDICLPTEKYISSVNLPEFIKKAFYRGSRWPCVLDDSFYCRNKQVYQKYFSWTTTLKAPAKCSLFILKESRKG